MNPALLVITLFSLAAAQPEPTCANGQQCDPGQLVGGDGDPALSLLQREALLKKKVDAHDHDDSEGEGEADVSKLSLLELAEKVGVHETAASATSLLKAVKEMAEQDARGELHADKITEQVLKTILESMEKNVIGAGQKMHKEDQNEVNRAHKAIDTCKDNMDDKFSESSGIDSLKTTTETGKSTLTTCKTEQATINSTQQKDCTDFESWVSGGLYNSRPSCICSLPKTASKNVLECINKAKSWGTTTSDQYNKMKAECDSSTKDLDDKGKKCDSDQSSFESAFCSYELLLTTTCEDYSKCHKEKSDTYATVCKDVKVDEVSRKAEFEAAKNVICYIGVLKAKAADKTKELKACKGKSYSTVELDLTYPTASSKATCDVSPVASKPCDASFLATHYNAAWSALAPAKACTPCAGPWRALCTSCDYSGSETNVGTFTLDVCKQKCVANPKCRAIDFGKNGRAGQCYLNFGGDGSSYGGHGDFDAYVFARA